MPLEQRAPRFSLVPKVAPVREAHAGEMVLTPQHQASLLAMLAAGAAPSRGGSGSTVLEVDGTTLGALSQSYGTRRVSMEVF